MGDGSGGDGSGGPGGDTGTPGDPGTADPGTTAGPAGGFGADADAAAAAAAVSGLASGLGLGDPGGFGGAGLGTAGPGTGGFGGYGGYGGVAGEGPSDTGAPGTGVGSVGGGLGIGEAPSAGTVGGVGGFGGFGAPGGFGNTGISDPSDAGFAGIAGIGPTASALGLSPSDSLGISSNTAQAGLASDVGTALGTLSAPDPTSAVAQTSVPASPDFGQTFGEFGTQATSSPALSAINAAINDTQGTQAPPGFNVPASSTPTDAELGITAPQDAPISNVPATMAIPGAVAAPVGYGFQDTSTPGLSPAESIAAAIAALAAQNNQGPATPASVGIGSDAVAAPASAAMADAQSSLAAALSAAFGTNPGTVGIGSDAVAAQSQPGISTSPAVSQGFQSQEPTAAEDAAALAEANQQAINMGYMNPDGTAGKGVTTASESLTDPSDFGLGWEGPSPTSDAGVSDNGPAGGGGNYDVAPDWQTILNQEQPPAVATTSTQNLTHTDPLPGFTDQTPPPVVTPPTPPTPTPPGVVNPAGGPGNPAMGNNFDFAGLLSRYPDLRSALVKWASGVQT